MIVSCPSCGTRYRHRSESAGEAAAARCSQCDDMVPLVVAGRPYLIVPAAGAERAGMSIGMDDPRLAAQLKNTSLDADSNEMPGAISYRIAAGDRKATPIEGIRAERFSGTNGSAPAIFGKRRSSLVSSKPRGAEKVAREKGSRPAAAVKVKVRSKTLEAVVTVMLAAVGAATAYFSASEQGLDPVTWTLAGGGLGLFMAWICLKWTRQQ